MTGESEFQSVAFWVKKLGVNLWSYNFPTDSCKFPVDERWSWENGASNCPWILRQNEGCKSVVFL